MASTHFSYETASAVLIHAIVHGDAKAAAHWGISLRTIQRYRVRLAGDELLSQAVAQKSRAMRASIDDKLELAIVSAVESLADLIKKAEPGEGTIHEVAGALKILVQVQVGMEVMRARTARVRSAA